MANDVDLNCEPHFASSTNSNGNTAPDLILSPNPTYGEISLKLKNFPNGIYHLILYNSFGQEIKRIEETSSGRSSEVMNMDASVLPPGNYWLSIQSEYLSKTIPFTCLR